MVSISKSEVQNSINIFFYPIIPQCSTIWAWKDNLENCIDLASDEAMNIVWDLTQAAKEDVDELIEDVQKFCKIYSSIIEKLREKEIKKVSSEIDNT